MINESLCMEIWFVISLICVLFLSACSKAVSEPTPTLKAQITVEPTKSRIPTTIIKTPTTTPIPTKLPTSIPSATDSPTQTPIPTPTLTKTPFPTLTPKPSPSQTPTTEPQIEITWSKFVQPITELSGAGFVWSPSLDEIAYLSCDKFSMESALILKAAAPTFSEINITPQEGPIPLCANSMGVAWRPNGQYLMFKAEAEFLNVSLWAIDRVGNNSRLLLVTNDLSSTGQWINNDQVLFSQYAGGGHNGVTIIDLARGETIGGLPIVWGQHLGIGNEYAAVRIHSPDVKPLVFRYPVDWDNLRENEIVDSDGFIYRSEVEYPVDHAAVIAHTWIPKTDRLIVQTWDKIDGLKQYPDNSMLIEDYDLTSNMHIWDVTSNSVALLLAGGRDISIQPNGQLAAITVQEPVTQTLIIEIDSGAIIDSFESGISAPRWLNDSYILINDKIRNIFSGDEIKIIEQPASGSSYFNEMLSSSGNYLSVEECVDNSSSNRVCKTHILRVRLP